MLKDVERIIRWLDSMPTQQYDFANSGICEDETIFADIDDVLDKHLVDYIDSICKDINNFVDENGHKYKKDILLSEIPFIGFFANQDKIREYANLLSAHKEKLLNIHDFLIDYHDIKDDWNENQSFDILFEKLKNLKNDLEDYHIFNPETLLEIYSAIDCTVDNFLKIGEMPRWN
jgi:hypothetical protein